MRVLLLLSLLAAGCGAKKSAPKSPATAVEPSKESELKDDAKPDDPDDPVDKTGADPCDGGE